MATLNLIHTTPLFRGMQEEEFQSALTFLHAHEQSYKKGILLCSPGQTLCRFGLVLSGAVEIYMYDLHGNRMIMANVTTGGSFGESLHWLDYSKSISIVTVQDSRLL